ncbi:MAG: SCO family protein [Magnetococcales bacterium]|nr:SCO family protein [Magnetococcales bacterium]
MPLLKNLPRGQKTALLAFIIGGLLTLVAQVGYRFYVDAKKLPDDLVGVVLPRPRVIPTFELVDHHGRPFVRSRFQDRWTFMFFGYTHCPDVCPVTMGLMRDLFTRLETQPEYKDRIQGVFVTIDPKRDTTKLLEEYVPFFNKAFIGVNGSVEEIERFSKGLGVGVRASPAEADGSYQIAHTSAIYLIDPRGRFHALFQSQFHDAEKMALLFSRIVSLYQ